MLKFSTVDLVKRVDDVKSAALKGPVSITEHKKAKFVLMSTEDFDRFRGQINPHKSYRAEDTPDFIYDLLKDDIAQAMQAESQSK